MFSIIANRSLEVERLVSKEICGEEKQATTAPTEDVATVVVWHTYMACVGGTSLRCNIGAPASTRSICGSLESNA